MKEKTWWINYSIKYKDGSIEETEDDFFSDMKPATIKARTIWGALRKAEYNIAAPLRKDPEIADVVIWGIEICEANVFQED